MSEYFETCKGSIVRHPRLEHAVQDGKFAEARRRRCLSTFSRAGHIEKACIGQALDTVPTTCNPL